MYRLKRNLARLFTSVLCWISGISFALATTLTYDFDMFSDSQRVTTQYNGLNFVNATVLTSGLSLNEVSFPPHSGEGVVFDDGGPIIITLDMPVQSILGYFTYMNGLTLSAYDGNNNLLNVAHSAYLTNLADGTGDAGSFANELLSVSSSSDQIARIVIASSSSGSSLVMDDLMTTASSTALAEPGTLALVISGLAFVLCCQAIPRYRS